MQELVFLTGMGRSGTSALTRLLSLCGAALPPALVPPGPDNPQGFWEPSESVDLNDRFLGSWGSSWYDPALIYKGPADAEDFVSDIADFLRRSFPNEATSVLKEPRISGLLDLWLLGAKRAGFSPKVVHIFRNPDEVAASLYAREGLPPELSQAMWLKYNLKPERSCRHLPRVFVSYEQVMLNPESTLDRCIRTIDVALRITETTRLEMRRFLRGDLQHHWRAGGQEVSDLTPGNWVSQLHAMLEGAAMGQGVCVLSFDRIFKEIADSQEFFVASASAYHSAKMGYQEWLRSKEQSDPLSDGLEAIHSS